MDSPTPPPAPDPVKTAEAQAASNKSTAVAQYGLNATNQVTPQGNLSYRQIGTWDDGTPRFESTQTYSPAEQALFEKGNVTKSNLADIANQSSSRIGNLLNTPFNVDTATADRIQGLQNEFLDPQWQRQGDALRTDLLNRGIQPGSEAYRRENMDFSTNRQRAYDQSYLDSYDRAQQSAITQRNQPINEISALLSGSQVSNPSYQGATNIGIAPTDVIGAQGQALAQQNVGYQGNLAQSQAITNGLFGLGSAALGGVGTALGGWARGR
jgi:hypothetical protein